MELDARIREALIAELKRQADRRDLTLRNDSPEWLDVDGRINLDELAMALAGALAGGP